MLVLYWLVGVRMSWLTPEEAEGVLQIARACNYAVHWVGKNLLVYTAGE